jgi:hypothetical protein
MKLLLSVSYAELFITDCDIISIHSVGKLDCSL